MDRTLFTNVTILDCTGAAPYAGEALVAECQAVVDQLDRETDDASQRESERIAAGIWGEVGLAEREEAAPSLQERLASRALAVQRHASARRASEKLRDEVERVQGELNRATYAIEDAAARLLLLIGEQIAQEILAAEAIARNTRFKLQGLARLWLARSFRPAAIKLVHQAVGVLNDIPLNDSRRQIAPAHDPAVVALQRWQEAAAALLADLEAPLPIDEA